VCVWTHYFAGSSSQQASEPRDSDPREISLPQKKAVPKARTNGGNGTLTVVEVDMQRGGGGGNTACEDDDDDDGDNDVEDMSSSDNGSDADTGACGNEVGDFC